MKWLRSPRYRELSRERRALTYHRQKLWDAIYVYNVELNAQPSRLTPEEREQLTRTNQQLIKRLRKMERDILEIEKEMKAIK